MRRETIATAIALACTVMAVSNAASAEEQYEYDRGQMLLDQMDAELDVDRVESREDRKMRKVSAAITVSWDINPDFQITSKAKWGFKIKNNDVATWALGRQ